MIPGGAASVFRWVSALDPANSSMDAWALLDDQLRLVLAQQWLLGPGRVYVPADRAEWDEFGAALSSVAGEHALFVTMLTDYLELWRGVYRMLDYRPALVAMQDPVGVDMETVVVTSDDYAGTFTAGAQIPGHTFITRLVDDEWHIAALARRLARPGWPPTEEVIPGLRVDGATG